MGPSVNTWLLTHPIIHFLCLPLDVFSTTLHIRLGFSHFLVFGVSNCICSQPLNLMGIHLLHCAHDGEKMVSYDVVRDAFVALVKDA